jgi:hypothetical protein
MSYLKLNHVALYDSDDYLGELQHCDTKAGNVKEQKRVKVQFAERLTLRLVPAFTCRSLHSSAAFSEPLLMLFWRKLSLAASSTDCRLDARNRSRSANSDGCTCVGFGCGFGADSLPRTRSL